MYGEFVSQMEDGGHVRMGYTYEELEALVTQAGLKPVLRDEVGGYGQFLAAGIHCWVQRYCGSYVPTLVRQGLNVAMFLALSPLLLLDRIVKHPSISNYILARK